MTFNKRESGTLGCQFIRLSQPKLYVFTKTRQARIIFSSYLLVSTSVIVKSIKNQHDALDEEGKESTFYLYSTSHREDSHSDSHRTKYIKSTKYNEIQNTINNTMYV